MALSLHPSLHPRDEQLHRYSPFTLSLLLAGVEDEVELWLLQPTPWLSSFELPATLSLVTIIITVITVIMDDLHTPHTAYPPVTLISPS